MHPAGPQGQEDFQTTNLEYDMDTAHSVEVHRDINERGQLGSFGFTLVHQKPPIVGSIVSGESHYKVSMGVWPRIVYCWKYPVTYSGGHDKHKLLGVNQ